MTSVHCNLSGKKAMSSQKSRFENENAIISNLSQPQFLTQFPAHEWTQPHRSPLVDIENGSHGNRNLLNLLGPIQSRKEQQTNQDVTLLKLPETCASGESPIISHRTNGAENAVQTLTLNKENEPVKVDEPSSSYGDLEYQPLQLGEADEIFEDDEESISNATEIQNNTSYHPPTSKEPTQNMVPLLDRIRMLRAQGTQTDRMPNLLWASRVCKTQQKALEMEESWQPPLPGKSRRDGTVPLAILEKLTTKADLRTKTMLIEALDRQVKEADQATTQQENLCNVRQDPAHHNLSPASLSVRYQEIQMKSSRVEDEESSQEEFASDWEPTPPRKCEERPEYPPDSSPLCDGESSRQPTKSRDEDRDVIQNQGPNQNNDTPLHIMVPNTTENPLNTTTPEVQRLCGITVSTVEQPNEHIGPVSHHTPHLANDVTNSEMSTKASPSPLPMKARDDSSTTKAVFAETKDSQRNAELVTCEQVEPFSHQLQSQSQLHNSAVALSNNLTSDITQAPLNPNITSGSRVVHWIASQTSSDPNIKFSMSSPLVRKSSRDSDKTQACPMSETAMSRKRGLISLNRQISPTMSKRRKLGSDLTGSQVHSRVAQVASHQQHRDRKQDIGHRMQDVGLAPSQRQHSNTTYAGHDIRPKKARPSPVERYTEPVCSPLLNDSKFVTPRTSSFGTNSFSRSGRSNLSGQEPQVNTPNTTASIDHSSMNLKQSTPPSSYVALFERYRKAYTHYEGTEKQFLASCRILKRMQQTMIKLHPSLFDDFIYQHHHKYKAYVISTIEEGESAMPYETFYFECIETPSHLLRVVQTHDIESVPTKDMLPSIKPDPHQTSPVWVPTKESNWSNIESSLQKLKDSAEEIRSSSPTPSRQHHVRSSNGSDKDMTLATKRTHSPKPLPKRHGGDASLELSTPKPHQGHICKRPLGSNKASKRPSLVTKPQKVPARQDALLNKFKEQYSRLPGEKEAVNRKRVMNIFTW